MHNNSRTFISCFNSLEKALREKSGIRDGQYHDFTTVLKAAMRNEQAIGRYYQDLMECKDLRNAIVHDSREEYIIAEPCDQIVARLQEILEKLTSSKRVMDILGWQLVQTVGPDDSLSSVMKRISELKISQFPIIEEGRITGIITADAITLWLADQMEEGELLLGATSIAPICEGAEDRSLYRILSRYTSGYEAAALIEQEPQIRMIMITETGGDSHSVLRVITRGTMAGSMRPCSRSSDSSQRGAPVIFHIHVCPTAP